MRWPWRYRGTVRDREGKELAKNQLRRARAIESESQILHDEHLHLLQGNHFGENFAKAMRGQ